MPNMDSEKYSLRQRQKRKHILTSCSIDSQGYASDNSTESIINLREIPQSRPSKSSQSSKSKSKAAPLSKYRRKTANARERTRMREINSAFETLRTCVPACITNEDSNSTNEKLTKITTLRLAMKYIGILSDALTNPNEADYDFLYECTQPKDIVWPALENFEPEIEEIPEKPQKLTKSSKNSKSVSATPAAKTTTARKPATTKRQTKKQKLDNLPAAINTSPIPASYQESPASNASSAYASLSSSSEASASPNSNSSYMFENNNNVCNSFTYSHPHHHNSMSDLSNLMLESDGESLNLSERCLSPLRTKQKSGSSADDPYECSPTNMHTLENPLELSLRLMEPATNSLSLSVDPIISPSACISPLMNLEPFSAFDLFHSEFNEQAALDLFLT